MSCIVRKALKDLKFNSIQFSALETKVIEEKNMSEFQIFFPENCILYVPLQIFDILHYENNAHAPFPQGKGPLKTKWHLLGLFTIIYIVYYIHSVVIKSFLIFTASKVYS